MLTAISEMNPQAKLWVYAFNKPFTDEQVETIEKKLNQFIDGWKSHKKDVKANFLFEYQQFILVVADTDEISGCGIDASSRIIDNLQRSLWLEGNDKNIIYYQNEKDNSDKAIHFIPRYQLQSAIKNNIINADTKIFNNGINTLKEYNDGNWETKACDSWLAEKLFSAV